MRRVMATHCDSDSLAPRCLEHEDVHVGGNTESFQEKIAKDADGTLSCVGLAANGSAVRRNFEADHPDSR